MCYQTFIVTSFDEIGHHFSTILVVFYFIRANPFSLRACDDGEFSLRCLGCEDLK